MKKIISIILFLTLTLSFVSAQSLGTSESPPRLYQLEGLLVQLVYVIWGLSGLIFAFLLGFLGFQYMTAGGDAQKEEEIKKKGKNWFLGLLLILASYPLVLTIYKVLNIGQANSDCYEDISTPGFHFFFPTVCTDPQATTGKYDLGSHVNCDTLDSSYLGDDKYCSNGVILPMNKYILFRNGTEYVAQCVEREDNGSCIRYERKDSISGYEYILEGTTLLPINRGS